MKINKLVILLYLCIMFMPISGYAYSDYIIPGGESIGIKLEMDGILVVGFYKVNGKLNKADPALKVGDKILKVEDTNVETVSDLTTAIANSMSNEEIELTFRRGDKIMTTMLSLIYDDNSYKTGLYVKDNITGIGTLTYIDPETNVFGALGHEVIESASSEKIEVRTGTIFKSSVTSIDRSTAGSPGGKNAKFYSSTVFGNIDKNLTTGIYGTYEDELPETDLKKVGSLDDVTLGEAEIYTVLSGEEMQSFKINITKIDKKSSTKNIYFEITDKELLEATGGIVQGMSGSPIIQNNMIIGAVTHVVVSSPSNGYGISIVTMLEDGEE